MKRWYVLQVYAGYEEIVKAEIVRKIKETGLQDSFGEILVPSAKLRQFFEASDLEDQQLFPGYVLVEMDMIPEARRAISTCARVLRFLGGIEPAPLTKREIDRILSQMRGEVKVGKKQDDSIIVGSEIEISEGPFAGFVGVVEKADYENEKLTVMVSIFGRMTPVELSFGQIKR